MHRFLTVIFCCVASTAAAENIAVPSQVREVTIHPDRMRILRETTVTVPAGKHRLVFEGIPQLDDPTNLRIEMDGIRQIATVLREENISDDVWRSPAEQAALDRVRAVKARIQAVRDEAAKLRVPAAAAAVTTRFLEGLGQNEALATAGTDVLRDVSAFITAEAKAAGTAALEAEVQARQVDLQLADLNEELEAAEYALLSAQQWSVAPMYVAVEVETAQTTPAEVRLSYQVDGGMWAPAYEFHLNTGEAPELSIVRSAMIRQGTGEDWTDVTLHLSTVETVSDVEPGLPYPRRLQVETPQQAEDEAQWAGSLAEPMVEAPVIIEDAASRWESASSLSGVTYTFADPVSVKSGADFLLLELDRLDFQPEVVAWASPGREEAAYLMASFTNTSGEELLVSERVSRFVDGVFVGGETFEGLVAGDESEIGFGEIDGLQLTHSVLSSNEGERGVLSRSNERATSTEMEIRNLTDKDWPVRVWGRVAYSEQEDLQITWQANPPVSEENVGKRRGILAWDMDVAAGETRLIRLDTRIAWPEGMQLR